MTSITYALSGRLGNQLQLWACARTISLRYGLGFSFRPFTVDFAPLRMPRYEHLISRRDELRAAVALRRHRLRGHDWDASGNERGLLTPEWRHRRGLLVLDWSGVFTRVDEFRPTLMSELLGDAARPSVDGGEVAVHVRQGDAAYPQPLSYYVSALVRLGVRQGDRITLFSDGPREDLADALRQATGVSVSLPQGSAMGDLLHMSAHTKLVLSQSWFSYWAAFLSEAEQVVAPPEFRYYPTWTAV